MDKGLQLPMDHHLRRFASMMARTHPHLIAHAVAAARLVERAIPHLPRAVSLVILVAGAFLHDVGKVTWPPELFTKRGLDAADRAIIQAHPAAGANLVREAWPDAPEMVVKIIATHHERSGGKGYPRGVEPGYPAQVVAACEVVDAMTHDRGYREALPVGAALAEIREWAPGGVVDAVGRALGVKNKVVKLAK